MSTECTQVQMEFQGLGRRNVHAAFDGGHVSSDGGALLLREMDARLNLCARFAGCFTDYRDARFVEHKLPGLIRQRVLGLCLGYEDLNDHDTLSLDPLLAAACGNRDPEGRSRSNRLAREAGRALAGHSTLDRLELTPEAVNWSDPKRRYYKLVHHAEQIERFFVDVFLESFEEAPEEIVLDFDPTDILLHGEQEGRFFHGYYRDYCYLPMYVFCGNRFVAARLRTSNRDASDGALELFRYLVECIRGAFPKTCIIIRGDSAFAREPLMRYCEGGTDLYYVFGLARNTRLVDAIRLQLHEARQAYEHLGQGARVYTEFRYKTRETWSRARRVIAKAEHLEKGANPRFVVTNLPGHEIHSRPLYEDLYCARGEMENRIKEHQLDLFADRASSHFFRANQLRLWLSALAYVLMNTMRKTGLKNTRLAKATSATIRALLLKIGARVVVSVRRVAVHLSSAAPCQDVFVHAWRNLRAYPLRI
jgi:hypothetical protein